MANFAASSKVGFARIHQVVAGCLAVACSIIAAVAALEIEQFYTDKYLPESFINQIDISNLTTSEALQKLSSTQPNQAFAIELQAQHHVATLSGELLQPRYAYRQALDALTQLQTTQPWWQRYSRALGLGGTLTQAAAIACDPTPVASAVAMLAQDSHQPNRQPSVKLTISGNKNSLKIDGGEIGYELDATASTTLALAQCAANTTSPTSTITLIAQPSPTLLSDTELTQLKAAALKLVGKRLALKVQNQTFYLTDQQLVGFLTPQLQIDHDQISQALTTISQQLHAEPKNAEFTYDPQTLVVQHFVAPRDGLTLEQTTTIPTIASSTLNWLSDTTTEPLVELPASVIAKKPAITLEKTNDLGIAELIGLGESAYAHSIPNRVHNVALTAKKINLTIVKPGQEFSFNKVLGEVSAKTGFRSAYVIKNGKTELGDGGGVCQVSSTLFRAAMQAGLNITRRKPHSYRVSYYELNSKAGFDATVYAGEVDFRFLNDTPGHLLIYTETDSQNLTMKIEIYGTSDGRTSEISNYKAWGARPAPAPVYIDDPSLPPGKIKQIDWATGGLKTSFDYTVRDKFGTVKQQETYYSNYLPWSAKYLRGPSQ